MTTEKVALYAAKMRTEKVKRGNNMFGRDEFRSMVGAKEADWWESAFNLSAEGIHTDGLQIIESKATARVYRDFNVTNRRLTSIVGQTKLANVNPNAYSVWLDPLAIAVDLKGRHR